jgi:excisionase family DNA binding protein
MNAGLLKAREVAELFGTTEKFVYALARRGELPSVRLSYKCVRFDRSAVDTWLAAKRRGGCGDGKRSRFGAPR